MNQQPHAENPTLRDYVRPLWTRKWLVLAIVAVVTAGTYLYYASQPKEYEVSTKVYLQSIDPFGTANDSLDEQRAIQNQATLLLSRDVASSVARRIGTTDSPAALLESVTAAPSATSDFIFLTARRHSAKEAADVANGFATAFVELRSGEVVERLEQNLRNTTAQLRAIPRTTQTAAERAQLAGDIRRLRLTRTLASGAAQQIDPAQPPKFAVAPKPARNAVFAFALSLIAAIALAFVLDRFDRRIQRVEDLETLYGHPVLAVVPRIAHPAPIEGGVATPPAAVLESYRQLRVNLQLSALSGDLKRIAVTSAVPGEGKSTTVRNLAFTLAEMGQRVLVVDGDLRRPTLPAMYGLQPAGGLTDVLLGDIDLAEAISEIPVASRPVAMRRPGGNGGGAAVKSAASSGTIGLLSAGAPASNPPAVFESDAARMLFDELAESWDTVLVDTSPLLAVSDAMTLLPNLDGVIVVSRIGVVTRDQASRAMDIVRRVPTVTALGLVANDVPPSDPSTPRGYESTVPGP